MASEHAREALLIAHAILKELKKYPDTEFVEVLDGNGQEHVQIRTRHGKLQIDVQDPGETVHLLIPLATLEDVTAQLESNAPAA